MFYKNKIKNGLNTCTPHFIFQNTYHTLHNSNPNCHSPSSKSISNPKGFQAQSILHDCILPSSCENHLNPKSISKPNPDGSRNFRPYASNPNRKRFLNPSDCDLFLPHPNRFTPQTASLHASDLQFFSAHLKSQIATHHLKSQIVFNFLISWYV